jgi:hypothetical protein
LRQRWSRDREDIVLNWIAREDLKLKPWSLSPKSGQSLLNEFGVVLLNPIAGKAGRYTQLEGPVVDANGLNPLKPGLKFHLVDVLADVFEYIFPDWAQNNPPKISDLELCGAAENR